jgi:hypothetical protein
MCDKKREAADMEGFYVDVVDNLTLKGDEGIDEQKRYEEFYKGHAVSYMSFEQEQKKYAEFCKGYEQMRTDRVNLKKDDAEPMIQEIKRASPEPLTNPYLLHPTGGRLDLTMHKGLPYVKVEVVEPEEATDSRASSVDGLTSVRRAYLEEVRTSCRTADDQQFYEATKAQLEKLTREEIHEAEQKMMQPPGPPTHIGMVGRPELDDGCDHTSPDEENFITANGNLSTWILVDSGAAGHVCPRDWMPQADTCRPAGLSLKTVSGESMKHYGSRTVRIKFDGAGGLGVATFEVTDVRQPILSGSALMRSGHTVVFSPTNPYLLRPTGEKLALEMRNGSFYLRAEIVEPRKKEIYEVSSEPTIQEIYEGYDQELRGTAEAEIEGYEYVLDALRTSQKRKAKNDVMNDIDEIMRQVGIAESHKGYGMKPDCAGLEKADAEAQLPTIQEIKRASSEPPTRAPSVTIQKIKKVSFEVPARAPNVTIQKIKKAISEPPMRAQRPTIHKIKRAISEPPTRAQLPAIQEIDEAISEPPVRGQMPTIQEIHEGYDQELKAWIEIYEQEMKGSAKLHEGYEREVKNDAEPYEDYEQELKRWYEGLGEPDRADLKKANAETQPDRADLKKANAKTQPDCVDLKEANADMQTDAIVKKADVEHLQNDEGLQEIRREGRSQADAERRRSPGDIRRA